MSNSVVSSDDYIVDESQEISLGENPYFAKILKAFPAFRHRNYQLYFLGQLVSLIGTWLQIVAQGWLVLQLTNSAFLVGVVAFLNTLPVMIFALFGGVVVDRFHKKDIIYFTQISEMMLALILGILTLLGVVNFYQIAILSFLLGTISALDLPARQTFVVELVGKEDLPSAIALNSGVFNGARVVGPAFAGILITAVGTGGAFIINGLSFLAVIFALTYIKVTKFLPKSHPHPLRAIKDGLVFSYTHQTIRSLLLFAGVTSIFGWSAGTILPVIVQNDFHAGSSVLGIMYSATGVGALVGVTLVSIYSKKVAPAVFIIGGSIIFSLLQLLFTFSNNLILASILLFIAGIGLIMQFSMTNSTIQHLVPDNFRGRVMSIYTLMFLGMSPIGSLQIGWVAEHFGSLNSVRFGAIILLISVSVLIVYWKKTKPVFLNVG